MVLGVPALDFLATAGQGESIGETVARILREREEAQDRMWREAIDRLVAQKNLIDNMFAVGVDASFPSFTISQKPGWQSDGSFVLYDGTVLLSDHTRRLDDGRYPNDKKEKPKYVDEWRDRSGQRGY